MSQDPCTPQTSEDYESESTTTNPRQSVIEEIRDRVEEYSLDSVYTEDPLPPEDPPPPLEPPPAIDTTPLLLHPQLISTYI